MSRLAVAIAAMLEPGVVKQMTTPPGQDLTASEAAALKYDNGAIARRIGAQIVLTVKQALAANPRLIEDMLRAHDREDSAQRGEPDLWAIHDRGDWATSEDKGGHEGDEGEWELFVADRRAAMLAALQVVGLA